MAFSNGQLVQAADLNNFSVTTVTTTGDITCGDDLDVTGTLTVGGVEISTLVDRHVCSGRLTLTTGVPVTTADVTAATTLYFALYGGDQVALYTGTTWTLTEIAQLSVAVPATTNQMYDAFVDYNDGTPQLVLTAWTNDTTRATALTTQDGVLVKTGDTQQRYVGSFRTTGVSGQTEDSLAKRYVWNYYNRVSRPCSGTQLTGTYNYTTDTLRQFNANTAVQLDIVCGVSEDAIECTANNFAYNGSSSVTVQVTIGEDSTTAAAAATMGSATQVGALQPLVATLRTIPAVGRHTYVPLERSGAAGTSEWGPTANTMTAGAKAGITGMWRA